MRPGKRVELLDRERLEQFVNLHGARAPLWCGSCSRPPCMMTPRQSALPGQREHRCREAKEARSETEPACADPARQRPRSARTGRSAPARSDGRLRPALGRADRLGKIARKAARPARSGQTRARRPGQLAARAGRPGPAGPGTCPTGRGDDGRKHGDSACPAPYGHQHQAPTAEPPPRCRRSPPQEDSHAAGHPSRNVPGRHGIAQRRRDQRTRQPRGRNWHHRGAAVEELLVEEVSIDGMCGVY